MVQQPGRSQESEQPADESAPARVVTLTDVSHEIVDAKKGHLTVLREVTARLPSTSNLAILGPDPTALSAFLHLLAGSALPDRGRIDTDGVRFSPVMNSGGAPGCLVLPMSVIDNVQFFARLHGIDSKRLLDIVESVCQLGPLLRGPIRALDVGKRRAVETAIVAALPYDCYLIDRLDILTVEFRWLVAHSVKARAAGMIFVTADEKVAARFCNEARVLEDGRVRRHWRLSRNASQAMRNVTPDG